jgi:hypothetical protein
MPKKQNKQEQILLKLEVIVVDDSVQSRVTLNNDIIDDYRNKYENGVTMPPLRAVHDKKEHILADGFHRFYALKRAGIGEAEFVVTDGTVEDAKFISITSNTEHGLPRTNADKRRAVMMALQNECFKEFSDRGIAETLKIDHKTVSKIRREMEVDRENGKNPGIKNKFSQTTQITYFQLGISPTENSENSQDSETDPIVETIEKSFEKEKRTGKDGKKYPVTKTKLKPVRKKTVHKEPPPIEEFKHEFPLLLPADPRDMKDSNMFILTHSDLFVNRDDKYLRIDLPLPLDAGEVLTIVRNAIGQDMFNEIADMND